MFLHFSALFWGILLCLFQHPWQTNLDSLPFFSFLNIINQILAVIILEPLFMMAIQTKKGPDFGAPTVAGGREVGIHWNSKIQNITPRNQLCYKRKPQIYVFLSALWCRVSAQGKKTCTILGPGHATLFYWLMNLNFSSISESLNLCGQWQSKKCHCQQLLLELSALFQQFQESLWFFNLILILILQGLKGCFFPKWWILVPFSSRDFYSFCSFLIWHSIFSSCSKLSCQKPV